LKRTLQLNPANKPSAWTDIKHWREAHKRAPVVTVSGTFDADDQSDKNFIEMIETFTSLTTLDTDERLTWKRADNSYIALSKPELEAVYSELRRERAVRGAILHVKAEQFNAMSPTPTPAQLSDITFWMT